MPMLFRAQLTPLGGCLSVPLAKALPGSAGSYNAIVPSLLFHSCMSHDRVQGNHLVQKRGCLDASESKRAMVLLDWVSSTM